MKTSDRSPLPDSRSPRTDPLPPSSSPHPSSDHSPLPDSRSPITRSIAAIQAEIEAVKLRPSRDVLFDGDLQTRSADKEHFYVFKSTQQGLKFAERIKAVVGDQDFELSSADFSEDTITLKFPVGQGKRINRVELEWENDFVLRRLLEALERINDDDSGKFLPRLARLHGELRSDSEASGAPHSAGRMPPDPGYSGDLRIEYDTNNPIPAQNPAFRSFTTSKNCAPQTTVATASRFASSVPGESPLSSVQFDAVCKSLKNPVTFIWGPPGTGKTATLGHIAAEFLREGKSVLFVSNTNRAVDVGLLSIADAMVSKDMAAQFGATARYGETALDSELLQNLHFESRLEQKKQKLREECVLLDQLLSQKETLEKVVDERSEDSGTVPDELEKRLQMLHDQIKSKGGTKKLKKELQFLQTRLDNLEYFELRDLKLVATTLAKVCTSEALTGLDFDAVVIDESSMASMPYMQVMASKARSYLVIAGDPMQLPPIAQADAYEDREWMETDVYAFASEAVTPSELFRWHDENPESTCFFDTQYRMKQDLAAIISDVFYEGRLLTAGTSDDDAAKTAASRTKKKSKPPAPAGATYRIINTVRYEPELTQKAKNGFNPVNEVHMRLISELTEHLIIKELFRPADIGIIVPFRSVVWDIRQRLRAQKLDDVEVGTVHTFQGREKRVILFDTVMSGEMQFNRKRHYSVRPFDEAKSGLHVPRLLNVALSRAKDRLYILADMEHMLRVYRKKFMGRLLEKMMGKGQA